MNAPNITAAMFIYTILVSHCLINAYLKGYGTPSKKALKE
jgi:hypothetical protein